MVKDSNGILKHEECFKGDRRTAYKQRSFGIGGFHFRRSLLVRLYSKAHYDFETAPSNVTVWFSRYNLRVPCSNYDITLLLPISPTPKPTRYTHYPRQFHFLAYNRHPVDLHRHLGDTKSTESNLCWTIQNANTEWFPKEMLNDYSMTTEPCPKVRTKLHHPVAKLFLKECQNHPQVYGIVHLNGIPRLSCNNYHEQLIEVSPQQRSHPKPHTAIEWEHSSECYLTYDSIKLLTGWHTKGSRIDCYPRTYRCHHPNDCQGEASHWDPTKCQLRWSQNLHRQWTKQLSARCSVLQSRWVWPPTVELLC